MINPIEWTDEGVRMIDQRKLPTAEEYPVFKTYREIADAIRSMVVRGAPAIGVAAAMGVALGVRDSKARNISRLREEFDEITGILAATRPTAVNLFWAIERMKRLFNEIAIEGADRRAIADRLIKEALAIQAEDIEGNKRIGRFGQELLPNSGTILTHCNAGALATRHTVLCSSAPLHAGLEDSGWLVHSYRAARPVRGHAYRGHPRRSRRSFGL